MDRLLVRIKGDYARNFRVADEGYYAGQVAATAQNRKTHWENWTAYVRPLGLDPLIQGIEYTTRVRALTGFAKQVRQGKYGWGKHVATETVVGAITAVGQEVALVCGQNPTKIVRSETLLPRLSQIFDGWRKEDPPTSKQLPVEADVPELLVERGRDRSATPLDQAIGDLALIAFYYLLRIGEYTVKGTRNKTKQTVQFKYEDITFFKKNAAGKLRCLPCNAAPSLILTADGATMKLDNQKNGWKGVCIFHEANGEVYLCPVRALGRRYVHIRQNGGTTKTMLSSYWSKGIRADVTAERVSKALKSAATELQYPTKKGIPIFCTNAHSLRSCGANALSLSGYSNTQIQKMGRWHGATFKEYIREELACYAHNMSRDMTQKFKFVNIAGNAFTEIPHTELHVIEADK